MKKIFLIPLFFVALISCEQNSDETAELKSGKSIQIEETDEPKYIDSIPNPAYLLESGLIKTLYPDYDTSKFATKYDNLKGLLSVKRNVSSYETGKIKYLRLSTAVDPRTDESLKDRIETLTNYEYVEGLGFDAAWNPKLYNLTFRHKGLALNLLVDDDDMDNDTKLKNAKKLALEIVNRIDNL